MLWLFDDTDRYVFIISLLLPLVSIIITIFVEIIQHLIVVESQKCDKPQNECIDVCIQQISIINFHKLKKH